ncbi:formylglycine-generating enzyme family protein [Sphingomonas sp. 37zxx]|uniref:formylglycine-generating enzyme family protein n=1 Tax=Sphingomonas sp. 37zxx TaxID=1550073 RepID=UPI00053BF4B7|nr:formylglycine-generating enzyme family protein [Sphingomonas sp. 37zxx]
MRRSAYLFALLFVGACNRSPDIAQSPADGCATQPDAQMRWIAGGRFAMGEDARYPEEGPLRSTEVAGFWIDPHEVTNAQFAAFVRATGYRTLAERAPPVLADAPPEMRVPGSAVFGVPSEADPRWWRWMVGAQWRHPSGPGESIAGHDRDPVVQIAYDDALAYARWAGKDLPTEAQWEYAARGGEAVVPEPVGRDGAPAANYYQGVFPVRNLATDGYVGRAPVGCFPANRYGLYDMIGNVWEWTRNAADASGDLRVIKGGSYLCAANYCARYRPAARQFQERGLGTDHIGFRLVDNRRPPPVDLSAAL